MSDFAVSEIFQSVQGEGRFIGRPSTFLRLAGCNLGCVWCDSAYTWRFSKDQPHIFPKVYDKEQEVHLTPNQAVYETIRDLTPNHLVITGGEPLLQSHAIHDLLAKLLTSQRPWSIEFETAGTLPPLQDVWNKIYYTVSPKLVNSQNSLKARRKWDMLYQLRDKDSVFKFVICDLFDLDEVDEIVRQLGIAGNRVYIMPEGLTASELSSKLGDLAAAAIERDYNLTTRLQIYAFGNRRGT